MEENKIVEGNKAIAEFMGGNVQEDMTCANYTKMQIPQWAYQIMDFDTLGVDGYEYHESWDWLMPVVEKIESLPHHDRPDFNYVVTIESGYCVITDNGEAPIAEAQWDGPKIDLVWHCVVAFINWKNSQHG